jgi:hypothetical protein
MADVVMMVVTGSGATGAPDTVNAALLCAVEPAKLAAVTWQTYCPPELAVIEFDVAPGIGLPFRLQL